MRVVDTTYVSMFAKDLKGRGLKKECQYLVGATKVSDSKAPWGRRRIFSTSMKKDRLLWVKRRYGILRTETKRHIVASRTA